MTKFTMFLMTITFGITVVHAEKVKANPLFTSSEISQMKSEISKENLLSVYKKKDIDGANDVYYKVVTKFASKAKKLKAGKNGDKLTSNDDKDFLIYIVNITQFFTDKIDGGLIHFYGYGKLYQVLPVDLEWAIERSNLSKSDRELMLEALKSDDE
jgi:hypothetical protein